MDGNALVDHLVGAVRHLPRLKVLFPTGYTRNATVHHGRLDPGVQLIGKPFPFDELGMKVRAVRDDKPA